MSFEVEPVELRGDFVILEPISTDHVSGLFAVGQCHEDWTYLPIPGFATEQDAEAWVDQAVAAASKRAHITFVLRCPSTGRVMGSSRYMSIRRPHRGLEIGYTWLGREFQRTPVNTEAKLLLLSHAFEDLGAYRVELKTDRRNLRSQRAIERIGAEREGILRCHMVAQHDFVRDSVLYSITFRDWPKVKRCLREFLGGATRPNR